MSTPVTSRPFAASSTEIRPGPQPASKTEEPFVRPAIFITLSAMPGASAHL